MSEQWPTVRPREVAKAIQRAGFVLIRQRGSHAHYLTATIPMHGGDLPHGTLRSILRQARMTPEEF